MNVLGTLFQTSFYFSFVVIAVLLCVAFVANMAVFGAAETEIGMELTGDSANIFNTISGLTGGLEFIWGVAITLGAVGAIGLTWISQSTTPIGIYLFEAVVWTGYTRSMSILMNIVPDDFLLIGTVLFLFMTTGAVIGMLSGSG